MMAETEDRTAQLTGGLGEKYAAEYLQGQGYRILQMNFRVAGPKGGEVDIVALKEGFVVFVEVKARRRGCLTSAQWAVTRTKQRRIISAAQEFLYRYSLALQPRFDVICLETAPSGEPFRVLALEHYENAFTL